MKKIIVIYLLGLFFCLKTYSQTILTDDYIRLAATADSLFSIKNYTSAKNAYLQAFEMNFGLGKVGHRYRSAICFTMTFSYDSAFLQLNKIAKGGKFSNYQMISQDVNFDWLHSDKRWQILMDIILSNKKEEERKQ